jgi:hypothetical protein
MEDRTKNNESFELLELAKKELIFAEFDCVSESGKAKVMSYDDIYGALTWTESVESGRIVCIPD